MASCDGAVNWSFASQKLRLAAALQGIWEGQTAYTPAAIYGEVITNERVDPGEPPQQVGKLWANIQAIPPTPEHQWSRDSFSLQVSGLLGRRINIQTDPILSPTLDIWNTRWFRDFLKKAIVDIQKTGTPQRPVRTYRVVLPPNDIVFLFTSSMVPGTEVPTFEDISNVLRTLDSIFEYQGARQLKFNLVDDKDGHIGVGYMEFIRPRVNALDLVPVNTSSTSAAISSS